MAEADPRIGTPKTHADYLVEARGRQAGHGFSSALLSITDEELAQADLHMQALINPDVQRASQDAFYDKYGIRRGDDKRTDPPIDLEAALNKWGSVADAISTDYASFCDAFDIRPADHLEARA